MICCELQTLSIHVCVTNSLSLLIVSASPLILYVVLLLTNALYLCCFTAVQCHREVGSDAREDSESLSLHTANHSVLYHMGRSGAVCTLLGHQMGAATAGPEEGEACQEVFVTVQ